MDLSFDCDQKEAECIEKEFSKLMITDPCSKCNIDPKSSNFMNWCDKCFVKDNNQRSFENWVKDMCDSQRAEFVQKVFSKLKSEGFFKKGFPEIPEKDVEETLEKHLRSTYHKEYIRAYVINI